MKKSLGAKPMALPSPVWVIGSYASDGKPNLMVVSWGGICCTNPPCIAISIQKTRKTYINILDSKAFTVNVPSMQFMLETDYLGMVSGFEVEKFTVSGLTAIKSDLVNAPYVKEFSLNLECSLLKTVEIGSHTQFIGQILDVKADQAILGENNLPDATKVDPLISSVGNRAYFSLGGYLDQAYSPGALIHEIKKTNQLL